MCRVVCHTEGRQDHPGIFVLESDIDLLILSLLGIVQIAENDVPARILGISRNLSSTSTFPSLTAFSQAQSLSVVEDSQTTRNFSNREVNTRQSSMDIRMGVHEMGVAGFSLQQDVENIIPQTQFRESTGIRPFCLVDTHMRTSNKPAAFLQPGVLLQQSIPKLAFPNQQRGPFSLPFLQWVCAGV